jgi:hypothetical protein
MSAANWRRTCHVDQESEDKPNLSEEEEDKL